MAPFLSLVGQLASRHGSGGARACGTAPPQDAEECVSRLYFIACDLIAAFPPVDLVCHLNDMMAHDWTVLLHGGDGPHASPAAESAATLIAASGALVGYAHSHPSEFVSSGAGPEWVASMSERWQTCVLQLLSAQPPFPAEVHTAAGHTIAQLSLLPGRCCDGVMRAACEALETGQEDGLSASLATALLGHVTSLLVLCRPFQLGGAEAAGTGTQAGRRTRLATQRPAGDGAAPPSDRVDPSPPAHRCAAIPDSHPLPAAAQLGELKEALVRCCLLSLGATVAGGHTHAGRPPPRRAVPVALVCQRVLIPLLLLDGSRGLEQYEHVVHDLLRTLACGGGGEDAPFTTALPASRGSACEEDGSLASGAIPSAGAAAVSAAESPPPPPPLPLHSVKCDEVVLLIAALFDFLFRRPTLDRSTDFRFSDLLWTVVSTALHRSLTATELDAGHRANMQLRVEYLLKRIVHLTRQSAQQQQRQLPSSRVIEFHPLFRWCSAGAGDGESPSAVAWESYFLVLESLNEYGWHIIEPVMARLDALVAQLETHLAAEAATRHAVGASQQGMGSHADAALHPRWIEMLLLKVLLHPNLGVRKVGLRRVWRLPPHVLRSLSASFLFHHAFVVASDPRLCGDIDRVPITASFLDTKAFEGTEVKAVPDVEPLAQEVEHFYASLFIRRWPASAQGDGDAGAVAGRIDALQRLLDTTLDKPPRFTVCVLARALLAIAQACLDHGVNSEPIVLSDGVLRRLHRFMRDSVQENIPFWLDVRVTAILFAALTTLAAAAASPRRCRSSPAFWRLYCMCGPLGESGGHSIMGMDACGQYGFVGAAVEEALLQQWLVRLSAQWRRAEGDEDDGSLVAALLDVEGIVGRVEALLRAAPVSGSHAAVVDAVAVKGAFFLLGALTRTGSARHAEVVRSVGAGIAATAMSLGTRAYCTAAPVLASAACIVEFHHSVGSDVCARLWPLDTTLPSMAAALHGHIMAAVLACLRGVRDGTVRLDGGEGLDDSDMAWVLMHTSHLDVLAAAVAVLGTVACRAAAAAAAGGDGDAETDADAGVAGVAAAAAAAARAAEALHTPQRVRQLVGLLRECTAAAVDSASASQRSDSAGEAAEQARHAAAIILSRNTGRLLQSELCGFLAAPLAGAAPTAAETAQHLASPQTHHETPLPSAAAAGARCPVAGMLPLDVVEVYVEQLMALPALRAPAGTPPSCLTGMPWPSVLGQQGRYVYNILYVLLLSLCGRGASGSARTAASPPPLLCPSADFVARVQDYALGQLSECWTMNLASVYDLLLWVASSGVVDVVDHVAIADGMWEHMREVGARQYTRLAALAFSVLHYVAPHHPDYVRALLLRVLAGEGKEAQTADRDVYFAAVTAAVQVLHNPSKNWPVMREVLLYAAVLFNTNRDEEENESTVAVTEPLLWTWPEALRQRYPPTTRMSAVGRATAVATLLWCCHEDVAGRAVPLTLELLRMNACDPVVTHEPCMPNSRTHRTRMRLWQLLCALQPCLGDAQAVSSTQVEEVFRLVTHHCLTVNNMGSVRRLMELYAIRLVEQHPALYSVVSEALGSYALRPQVCGSYILVACHALLREEDAAAAAEEEELMVVVAHEDEQISRVDHSAGAFATLFPRILQQSTSNQHLLRIISHIGLVHICQRRLARGRPLTPAVAALYDYVLHAPEHVKFREKHAHMLFFDTAAASSPRSLFCVQRKEANTVLAEVLPAAAFERLRFVETEMCCMIGALYPMEQLRVRDWCASLGVQALVDVFKNFSGIPHTSAPCDYYVDYTREATELLTRDPMLEASPARASGDEADAATANIQKKVSSWWTSEVYNELHPRALRTQRQSIIVVGSLLENPVNLAGLCRCGEIFAVESIVVPDRKMFEHPHFIAAARSAELWIPWEEVMPKDLPGYLEGLRHRGYTVVGVEQTAASVSMERFAFPERCVVVLGAEGQGVPAPLIPLLDVCVEIPQYGLIRSLNVHVTGAIAMYEYTRQHLMTKSLSSPSPSA
ncbi:SpoU rRNA Methylase family [Novymonas esmeraldas]|uniref:SpoU rRNA Methylase family n=1 Tax=Novymonas esmeraldas TaxID=1808958 RepID=A0AAW0FCC5_9TRYP